MELKKYQKEVIADLKSYLSCLEETKNLKNAYSIFWENKGFTIGNNEVKAYQNVIKNTPRICYKVPTGGGKTLLAASSLKYIIDSMPHNKKKFVVWLVPSDAILTQTLKNLKDPNHAYHQKIASDFGGRFSVYSKDELFFGQNFNVTTASSQLNIVVLTYASIKINLKELEKIDQNNKSKKQDKKLLFYRENGNYLNFPKTYQMPNELINGINETAVIQVINQQNPIVIVDESHHTKTELSNDMLENLNPSFILDLTATPVYESNIISYVSAKQLKDEEMVKLPIIVYNRQNRNDVISNAIDLRKTLEAIAEKERKETKRYIRPIVLFQAEAKTNDGSETFLKIKEKLVESGIPKEQIAIKISKLDELENVELLSPDCPIRYIITVNALKEGWDCPFAYILATLANRSSKIDVEQIVGRILRQPNTKLTQNRFLNMSYVFTCSNKFLETVENIRYGLYKRHGYSENDCRIGTNDDIEYSDEQQPKIIADAADSSSSEEDNPFDFDTRFLKKHLENLKCNLDSPLDVPMNSPLYDILDKAKNEGEEYNEEATKTDEVPEIHNIIETSRRNEVYEQFRKDVEELRLPVFFVEQKASLFNEAGSVKLSKDELNRGFSLRNADSNISFEGADSEIGRLDLSEGDNTTPKYMVLNERERAEIKAVINSTPDERKKRKIKDSIYEALNKKYDCIKENDLKDYIDRILQNMDSDQLSAILTTLYNHIKIIEKHIDKLLEKHRYEVFDNKNNARQIFCKPDYTLPRNLIITNESAGVLDKSLYPKEGYMNDFEKKVITAVASLDCVKWWHRNPDREASGGFAINVINANHYPDFIIKTKGGKIIILETKGDDRDNSDSQNKAKIGNIWKSLAGDDYLYFMVFENKELNESGAYSFNKFIELMKKEIS